MIDNENVVFSTVSTALRNAVDNIFITGVEITDTPPQFPAVSIVKLNAETNTKASTFESVENMAIEEYQFYVYSNLESQKDAKEQVKNIIAVIHGEMCDLFYPRSFCQLVPTADAKITRGIARYKKTDVT